jgi:hypothetical protein
MFLIVLPSRLGLFGGSFYEMNMMLTTRRAS